MCAEDANAASGAEIRLCQPPDLPAILEILAEAPESANWSATSLQSALEQQSAQFLAAVAGGELAGFVAGRIAADEGEILNLAVRKRHRRKGLGRRLVQSLLEGLARERVATVFLEVRESNRAAIAFYQCLGFAPAGIRPGYYTNPPEAALILRMSLR